MARKRRRYSAGEAARRRHSWLELVQTSGPFLTLPVVERAFPNGMPEVPHGIRAAVRGAVADALESGGASRHAAIRSVLERALDWGTHLRLDNDVPAGLAEAVPEHGVVLHADLAFHADLPTTVDDVAGDELDEEEDDDESEAEPAASSGSSGPWRLLGMVSGWGVHPLTRTSEHGWTANAVERLAVLLRAREVPIGLVTDGRWWALVWAPLGGTTAAAVWDASLWSEEPETFRAFVALLNRARFLSVADADTVPALLTESLGAQELVTETLGRQVRDAVELLVDRLDRLDAESRVLTGVSDDELYEGVVTVMMRVVFLLFAEERRLLPSDDAVYVASYSVGRLAEQLAVTDQQVLERRTGAWHRLLAVTRALHGGVAHEDLRLPAYGGGLFDPDRFPWLEGRTGSPDAAARPPAVDDRTVLRLLRAVQEVQIDGERRRLSFRALDVEQIGYVYEGLLDLEVRTADLPMLSLYRPSAWPHIKNPSEVTIDEARERLGAPAGPTLAQWVAERSGWSVTTLEKLFASPVEAERRAALIRATGGDAELAETILPYAVALRWDELGRPAVTMPGRRYVAPSTRRAGTGTHYTPRALAEDVAANALEPLAHRPGPLETSDRSTWTVRPSEELLDLRVADIAMGSGAFLVAACRYLADKLVEAWEAEGKRDVLLAASRWARRGVSADAEVEQIALDARRLIAEHCLYGVDVNPLAVEMAKLSLWLVTMDRERPFGFLDDRLVAGDSLLGLASVDELTALRPGPEPGDPELSYAEGWTGLLAQAADLRRRITAQPVVTGRDVTLKAGLLREARALTVELDAVADAVTGVGLRAAGLRPRPAATAFAALSIAVGNAGPTYTSGLAEQIDTVQTGLPDGARSRRPLHWPLAFPEVFVDSRRPGFDVIVGNPPFLGGQKISGKLGDEYGAWLQRYDGRGVAGSSDLAARFVLRAERLLCDRGQIGFIALNTLVQGATLRTGLSQLVGRGTEIRRGRSSHPWPTSSANIEIVDLWASLAPVAPDGVRWLDGEPVPEIGADLEPVGEVRGRPQPLEENDDLAFQGSNILGLGFTVTEDQARELIAEDPRNAEVLAPYVIGKDLNQRPDCSASRWVINFKGWSRESAAEYPAPFEIVERLVKPGRAKLKETRTRNNWWLFTRSRPELYRAIEKLDHVLAISLVSSAVMPVRVPAGPVFAHKCAVYALDSFADLAVLSSSVHSTWVIRYTSTLESRINYSPSDVFLTLPRPQGVGKVR